MRSYDFGDGLVSGFEIFREREGMTMSTTAVKIYDGIGGVMHEIVVDAHGPEGNVKYKKLV